MSEWRNFQLTNTTTYEELKPNQPFWAQDSLAGFETTYEELKLTEEAEGNVSFDVGFETTYEELKLGEHIQLFPPLGVLRLPMRN